MCTTVRVVLFADSPFETQWADQVQSPRRQDWHEFVADKINAKKACGSFTGHFIIQATVSLRFFIAVLPGSEANMG